jgi:hypothetical protein
VGTQPVIGLETTTGTFIAEGFLSHNSHVKKYGEIWLRGIRNFFAGGGGMNLGESNPLWRPFQELVRSRSNVTTSADFVRYLEGGKVHQDILDWFIKYRFLGKPPFDTTPPMWPFWPDGTSEVREAFLAYYVYLHPTQMPREFIDRDREYMDYEKAWQIIWGPKAPVLA